jgi:transcriptional regulator with PAS, ATPase and Fis domain
MEAKSSSGKRTPFAEGRLTDLVVGVQRMEEALAGRHRKGFKMAVSGQKNGALAAKVVALPSEEIIFGRSPAMSEIRQKVEKVLATDVPILIQGDNGTGKGLLAQYIHSCSASSSGAFVRVNCAAIPGALLESELFGYEKGAFTNANTAKPGYVEMAHRGTLFLDKLTDIDTTLQGKLLHFLQDGEFSRIGDKVERSVVTRIICSTNKDLIREIDAGRFRADLFYRISVVQLRLPRLSERREDIPAIAEYLRTLYEKQFAKQSEPFGVEILYYLQSLSWPGNLRELANTVARYVLVGPETAELGLGQPPRGSEKLTRAVVTENVVSLKRIAREAIREMERRVILETLHANQWNRRKTAQALRISYRALIYKIRDAGLASRRTVSNRSSPQSTARPPISSTEH